MGKLDQMRAAASRGKVAGRPQPGVFGTPARIPPSPPSGGEPVPVDTPKSPKSPKPAPLDLLTHACGHRRRAAEIEASNCPVCCRNNRRRHWEKFQATAAGPDGLDVRHEAKGRLPHGSSFAVTYDATDGTWTGRLSVPGVGDFPGRGGGLFRLLARLDDQYRAAVGPPCHGQTE